MIRQNFFLPFRNLQNWERDKVGTSKAKFLLSPILLSVRKAYSYLHRFLVGTNFCKGSSGYIWKKKRLWISVAINVISLQKKKNATNFHALPLLLAMLFFPRWLLPVKLLLCLSCRCNHSRVGFTTTPLLPLPLQFSHLLWKTTTAFHASKIRCSLLVILVT